MNADNWITYLQHPLVLAGFGLFIFALSIRPIFLNNGKLSNTATERLLHKGMVLLFILAVLAMISGLILSWKATPAAGSSGSLPKEQIDSMLKQQETSIRKMINDASGDKEKRQLLEQKLKFIQDKQLSIQSEHETALGHLRTAEQFAAEIKEQLAAIRVVQDGGNMRQDNIERAEQAKIYENLGGNSHSAQSSGSPYASVPLHTVQELSSFSIEDIRIIHEAGIKVQFPGERTAQVLPADAQPSELLKVELLDLSNASLHRIPPWLRRFTNLRKLDLSKNQLDADSDLLETLQAMPKLDVLNLSGNPLFAGETAAQSLAPVWQRLNELGELYLSETQGAAKNYGSLTPLRSLKVLDLSGNKIANEVGALELNKLSGLEELNLSKNGISEFPGTDIPAQGLKMLDLSFNKLTEIPYVEMNELRIWQLQKQENGPVRLKDDYGDMFSLKELKKLQCDSPSQLPEGLKKRLERLQRELDCSTGGVKLGQYVDNCDGTITDTQTGLMWKRCSEGLSGVNCEEGETEQYKWNDAVSRFKDIEYARYKDWRLPTIDELKTLVYCSNGVKNKDDGECNDGSEKPTINQQAFPNTLSSRYWSGSPLANYSDGAWFVLFTFGLSNFRDRVSDGAVRLVRGGQPAAQQ